MKTKIKFKIDEIIKLCVNDYLVSVGEPNIITNKTVLFGSGALLDSMGLVNVIIDIETSLKKINYPITLTSEKAFSLKHSPFKSVHSLSNYIYIEIKNIEN